VAGRDDFADQLRMSLGNPAQHKEGSLSAVPREEFKQSVGVLNNSTGIAMPVGWLDAVGKRLDVEVVLYVDTQGIGNATGVSVSHACGLYHRTFLAVIVSGNSYVSEL
jgi:hypothetical protein